MLGEDDKGYIPLLMGDNPIGRITVNLETGDLEGRIFLGLAKIFQDSLKGGVMGVSFYGMAAGSPIESQEKLSSYLAGLKSADEKNDSDAVKELIEAIRLTVEYVGVEMLPPIEGWSWFDVVKKYDPYLAGKFMTQFEEIKARRAATGDWGDSTNE